MQFFRIASLLLIVVLLLSGIALAQERELISITIKVVLPNGRPGPEHLRVELKNALGIPLSEAITDDGGRAQFSVLRTIVSRGAPTERGFQVRISGVDLEETTESFIVMEQETVHTEFVHVKMTKSKEAESQQAATTATVGAGELTVPPKAKREFDKGSEALQRQEWMEARKRFEKAFQLYPKYALAYNNLGVALMNSGEPAKGREAFEKAISVDANFARAYVNLARIASSERRYEDAKALLKKSLSGDPLNPEALLLLASAEAMTGNYDEAIANARKVHSVPHQDYAIAHFVCAQVLQAKNLNEQAAEEYKVYLNEAPGGNFAARARAALRSLEKPNR